VVDDFGVKYTDPADAQYLADILLPHYKLHIDWSGDKYLGITLRWDYTGAIRQVALSLPGYILKVLSAFGYEPPDRPAHSPGGFVRPVYGKQTQLTAVDNAPALSEERKRVIMSKIGALQWYVRVTDPTAKCRLSQLSSLQAHATTATEAAVDVMLHYLHTHPDANLVYRASDMKLQVESDASYNSEPKATSRTGGVFFLGARSDAWVNSPVDEISTRCDAVCSSAAEAEYAALYVNARNAVELRQTLTDMGHPQGRTHISCDNSCAVGLANDTAKHRRSKAIDMRFHWIRDRIRQGQFDVSWEPGSGNLADYFTKNHPASHHQLMRNKYVHDITTASAA
jgi:hypothetical protein